MIKIELKDCCYECNYPDLYIDENEVFTVGAISTIYCSHAPVCKDYIESEEDV